MFDQFKEVNVACCLKTVDERILRDDALHCMNDFNATECFNVEDGRMHPRLPSLWRIYANLTNPPKSTKPPLKTISKTSGKKFFLILLCNSFFYYSFLLILFFLSSIFYLKHIKTNNKEHIVHELKNLF